MVSSLNTRTLQHSCSTHTHGALMRTLTAASVNFPEKERKKAHHGKLGVIAMATGSVFSNNYNASLSLTRAESKSTTAVLVSVYFFLHIYYSIMLITSNK